VWSACGRHGVVSAGAKWAGEEWRVGVWQGGCWSVTGMVLTSARDAGAQIAEYLETKAQAKEAATVA
jgi:hypothetical protein